MMTFEAENKYKAEIVAELFAHEKIQLPSVRHSGLDPESKTVDSGSGAGMTQL
jgi:hypothetical protein